MELKKKSLLIALVIGDGCLYKREFKVKDKTYKYTYYKVTHSEIQKEYIEWKATLMRKLTGKKCPINKDNYETKRIAGKDLKPWKGFKFECSHKYFRVLRKWLYPNDRKKLDPRYLNYLDPQGLAIWYMDDGSTYIDKKYEYRISSEISTHVPQTDAEALIEFFRSKWNIEFHLHKRAENQYNIRAYCKEAVKFLILIKPYVLDCMAYKIKIPDCYLQERTTPYSQGDDIV